MSRFERVKWKTYPLSQINGGETNSITWDVGLPPYVDQEKIGVNVGAIHTMMRLGGIRRLSLLGRDGETSDVTPTVVGHSPDGSAYAGKVGKAKVVPTYSVLREGDEGLRQPYYLAGRWADATVEVNLSEITDRMTQRGEPVRSTKAWSRELDHAVRKGVARAGMEHLIFDTTSGEKFGFALNTSLGTTLGVEQFGLAEYMSPGEGVIFQNLWFHGISNALRRFNHKVGGYDTEGFRWSLFSGPQFDRAALLQGMSKTKRVVKNLSDRRIKNG